jgi:hypothetical protein
MPTGRVHTISSKVGSWRTSGSSNLWGKAAQRIYDELVRFRAGRWVHHFLGGPEQNETGDWGLLAMAANATTAAV